MARIVQKYGGSSVADAASIKRVARRIARARQEGNDVVVVISAMGDATDELMDLALEVSPQPQPRELDMLLTTGERQSAALLAMALNDLGVPARSYTGSQAGVITTGLHGNARIIDITPGRVNKSLEAGNITIVAGFQGVSQDTKDVTTLGRGASDTTAVALAASLGAEYCEIYTDVDGVFSADPRIVPGASQLSVMTYEETLELAAHGAKVLHLRAVEFARKFNVPLHVRSSFSNKEGTWIVDENYSKSKAMEAPVVAGIAHDRSQGKITIAGVPNVPGTASKIFATVAAVDGNIDMIVQNTAVATPDSSNLSFTVPQAEIPAVVAALEESRDKLSFREIRVSESVGILSVVGAGMRSHSGVSAVLFKTLGELSVNVDMISTSEIRISVVVAPERLDEASRAVHTAFGLDAGTRAVVYGGTGR